MKRIFQLLTLVAVVVLALASAVAGHWVVVMTASVAVAVLALVSKKHKQRRLHIQILGDLTREAQDWYQDQGMVYVDGHPFQEAHENA